MRRDRLGRSGLTLPCLTLGTMGWGTDVDPELARDQLMTYADAGGDALDTAFGYGMGASEEVLGSLIGDVLPREDLRIITKAGISRAGGQRRVDTSRGALMSQLNTSLRRLGTDYVDLWLVHTWSEEVPLEETLSTLRWAVESGRARYVGVSNYVGWQLARAASLLEREGVPVVANEVEYSLLRRGVEHEGVPAAQALGVGLLAWSPLARGALTGKYRHSVPADSRRAANPALLDPYLQPEGRAVIEAVSTAATGLDVSPAEVALAWLTARPAVASAIVGARTLPQLRSALRSTELDIPGQVVAALNEVSA